MAASQNLLSLDKKGMEEFFASLGEKPFRARQLLMKIYSQGAFSLDSLTEFSAPLKEKLASSSYIGLPELVEKQKSADGTEKLLLRLRDGEMVETVLIPDEERLTQCVSTQAGCPMGCKFCRTASGGFRRNLEAGEIVGQVVAAGAYSSFQKRVTNVVFMGMGEPLLNLEAVTRAFEILTADWGFGISKRKITISTCGLVEEMKKLPPEVLASLAVSLNATTDAQRDLLMPVNRRHPIAELLGALKELSVAHKGQYTIEYVLLGGVNDTIEDARRLSKLLAGLRCKINLIPFNPHGESDFKAPDPRAVERFQSHLLERGFVAVLRKSRGEDIMAACGQLRADELLKSKESQGS